MENYPSCYIKKEKARKRAAPGQPRILPSWFDGPGTKGNILYIPGLDPIEVLVPASEVRAQYQKMASSIAARCRSQEWPPYIRVYPLLRGGAKVGAYLTDALFLHGVESITTYPHVSHYDDNGQPSAKVIVRDLSLDYPSLPAFIFDEVYESGESGLEVVAQFREQGMQGPLHFYTLCHKAGLDTVTFPSDVVVEKGIALSADDWLIGCGMDSKGCQQIASEELRKELSDAGFYRNLPFIGILRKDLAA